MSTATATDKPTIATVTAALTRAGWPVWAPGRDGVKVGPTGTPGIVRVDYETGALPVDKIAAMTSMAEVLRLKDWFVTESDRLLVSGG